MALGKTEEIITLYFCHGVCRVLFHENLISLAVSEICFRELAQVWKFRKWLFIIVALVSLLIIHLFLFWLHRSSNTLVCCSIMSLRMLCCINHFSSCLWVRPTWLPLNLPLMMITTPSLLLRLSIAIWPLLFWNSIVPISIRKPCSVPASPTNSLDLQRTTHHWASQNAGDPSSAHCLSLWTRTLSQEQSGLMDIHSISYFSESFDFFPSVCHCSSGICTLLIVGHCFFQASKGQLNTITWGFAKMSNPMS